MGMEVANAIAAQLGGLNRLAVMIGAKNFVGMEDGLRFRMMKGKGGCNMAEIKLNARDLYDVRFLKVRGFDCDEVAKAEDVYVDMLADVFWDDAGLAIKL